MDSGHRLSPVQGLQTVGGHGSPCNRLRTPIAHDEAPQRLEEPFQHPHGHAPRGTRRSGVSGAGCVPSRRGPGTRLSEDRGPRPEPEPPFPCPRRASPPLPWLEGPSPAPVSPPPASCYPPALLRAHTAPRLGERCGSTSGPQGQLGNKPGKAGTGPGQLCAHSSVPAVTGHVKFWNERLGRFQAEYKM